MTTVTVVCPVYREEASIGGFHAQLTQVLAKLPPAYKANVLYVIDPSADGTVEAIKALVGGDVDTTALVMSNRFGHQMALLAGMDECSSDVLITMDSDLQHPPELIPTLLERYEAGFDVVQAVRTETQRQSFFNRTMSHAFYRVLNRLSDTDIVRGGADYRLLSRRVVTVFQGQMRERNQFLRGLIPWVGFRTCHVPFVAGARLAGESNYSLARSMRLATDGLISFSKIPLRLGIAGGLGFAALSFIYALYSGVLWLIKGTSPSGWTSLAVLIAGLSGVLLTFMGILGLYIGAIFDEVKSRPHYIIAERIEAR